MGEPGRAVVITGASGIAAAAARQLAARGDRCFVISRSAATCELLVGSLGASGTGFAAADLQDESQAVSAFAAAADALGTVDAVVAVAGGSARKFGDGWLHDMSLDAWNAQPDDDVPRGPRSHPSYACQGRFPRDDLKRAGHLSAA